MSLLEDGSERGGPLGFDVVALETVSEGRSGTSERVGVSTGADTQASTRGRGALEVGDHRLLEDGSERGGALGTDAIVIETARDGWGQ